MNVMVRVCFISIGIPIFYLMMGCTQSVDNFRSEECLSQNPNCSAAEVTMTFKDTIDQNSLTTIKNADNLGTLTVKPTRYKEQRLLLFNFRNTKLIPLKFNGIESNDSVGNPLPAYTVFTGYQKVSCLNRTLYYGETCSIPLVYTPEDVMLDTAQLSLKFKNLIGQNFNLSAQIIPSDMPESFSSDASIEYILPSDQPHQRTINFTNHGKDKDQANLNLDEVEFTLSPDSTCKFSSSQPSSGGCLSKQTLNTNETCSLNVDTMVDGPSNKCVLVASSQSGVIESTDLQPRLVFSRIQPTSLDFGAYSGDTTRTFLLSLANFSDGSQKFNACNFSFEPSSSNYSLNHSACIPLEEGKQCEIEVTINATLSSDQHSRLNIACDNVLHHSLEIHGFKSDTGISSDKSQLTFILDKGISPQQVTLKNDTASGLDIYSQLSSDSSVKLRKIHCNQTINPSEECIIEVQPMASTAGLSSLKVRNSLSGKNFEIPIIFEKKVLLSSVENLYFPHIPTSKENLGQRLWIRNHSSRLASGCEVPSSVRAELEKKKFYIEHSSSCLHTSDLAPQGGECYFDIRSYSRATDQILQLGSPLEFTCSSGHQTSVMLNSQSTLVDGLRPLALPNIEGVLVGMTQTVTVPFRNYTGADVTNPQFTLSPHLTATSVPCSSPLGNFESCYLKVEYTPLNKGTDLLTITPQGDESVEYYSVDLQSKVLEIESLYSAKDLGIISTSQVHTTPAAIFRNPSSKHTAQNCHLDYDTSVFDIAFNSCQTSLAPQGLCSVAFHVKTASTSRMANEEIKYTCTEGGTALSKFAFHHQKPPQLEVLDENDNSLVPPITLGYVDVGDSKEVTFHLKHQGLPLDASATQVLASLSHLPDFQIISNNCPTTITPGSICEIKWLWKPNSSGEKTALFSVASRENPNLDILVEGESILPADRITLSTVEIQTDNRLVGSTSHFPLEVKNNTPFGDASPSFEFLPASGAWSSSSTCTTPIGPQDSCTLDIEFKPISAGISNAQLKVANGALQKSINLSGESTTIVNLPGVSYNFGDVDLGVAKNSALFKFKNPSIHDQAKNCQITVPAQFNILSSTCSPAPDNFNLATQAECQFIVELTPQSAPIEIFETMITSCEVGGQVSTELKASIKDYPAMDWTGLADLGEQDIENGHFIDASYTLTNQKPYSIVVDSFALAGDTNDFTILPSSSCTDGSELTSASSCQLDIRFLPLSLGTKNILIEASSSLPNPYKNTFSVSAKGTKLGLSLSTLVVKFSDVEANDSVKKLRDVTINNSGNRTALLNFLPLTQSNFEFIAGTCTTIPAQGACTFQVSHLASAAAEAYEDVLEITDIQNGATTSLKLDLEGETKDVSVVGIKDNRDQTDFISIDITTTDITGPIDHVHNIVNLSPASQSATFTLKNTILNSGPIEILQANLTHQSGKNSTMSVSSNTCSGTPLLESGNTCEVKVTYTPTTNMENSVYTLTLIGESTLSSRAIQIGVGQIIGASVADALLTIDLPDLFIPLTRTSQTNTRTVVLKNEGVRTAQNLVHSFVKNSDSILTKTSTCGTTLAGGQSCQLEIQMTPGNFFQGIREAINITSDTYSLTPGITVHSGSYKEGSLGGANISNEVNVASDANNYYFVSRYTSGDRSYPVINICKKGADKSVDTCSESTFYDQNIPFLAGVTLGSGPQIAINNDLIFIALENQMLNKSVPGQLSVLACKKSPSSNYLTFIECAILDPHAQPHINIPDGGQYVSVKTDGNKVVFSSRSPNGYILTACSINKMAGDPTDLINLGSCQVKHENIAASPHGYYGAIHLTGSEVVYTHTKKSAGTTELMGLICNLQADNHFDCGNNLSLDNYSETISGTTFHVGAFPSIDRSGDKLFITHQAGESFSKILRLSTCELDTVNLSATCSSQSVRQSVADEGVAWFPAVKVVELANGKEALLLKHARNSDFSSSFPASAFEVFTCDLDGSTPNCSTSSFVQQNVTGAAAALSSRFINFDKGDRVLTVPFGITSGRIGYSIINIPWALK